MGYPAPGGRALDRAHPPLGVIEVLLPVVASMVTSREIGDIPGPQLRGTGGTFSVLWKRHRDRGHPRNAGMTRQFHVSR
jgi:hypothetical protein